MGFLGSFELERFVKQDILAVRAKAELAVKAKRLLAVVWRFEIYFPYVVLFAMPEEVLEQLSAKAVAAMFSVNNKIIDVC